MSISAALSNALSGLTAASRGTEVVASNLANNLTPGYGARELQLSSRNLGGTGGVRIVGVERLVPAAILADNRIANASLGHSSTTSAFHVTMEAAVGTVNQDDSLTMILADFEAALASATGGPESNTRLQSVVHSAEALSNKINYIAMELQKARTIADKAIESDVNRLNSTLAEVARLNRLVTIAQAKGEDASSLIDARQAAIDGISDIVPVKELQRENGMIALFTKGGATLLDGLTPAKLSFTPAGTVTPQMSVATGQLFTLSMDGLPLSDGQMGMFKGGSLAANFQIRDELAPSYQDQIDHFAQDLYLRLNDPNVDPTATTGSPGLFTDRNASLDPVDLRGFANRITINRLVDPEKGGELWRIRDGVNATQPGPSGNAALLNSIRSALNDPQNTLSIGNLASSRMLSTNAADLMSNVASLRLKAQAKEQHDSSYQSAMEGALLSHGVDSDKELERLLALEKSYAANAKVIQAANDMLDNLLRMS